MLKKMITICTIISMILSILPATNIVASNDDINGSVTFFDCADNKEITVLKNQQSIYAEVKFTAPKDGEVTIVTAQYNSAGILKNVSEVSVDELTPGSQTTYTTEKTDVSDAGEIRIFVWDGYDNLVPVLKNPGQIERTLNIEGSASAEVSAENGATAEDIIVSTEKVSAFVPTGTQLADGATVLSLSVSEIKNSQSNISVKENEIILPIDIHMEGISENNRIPVIVTVTDVLAPGLNKGNLSLYHVEKGQTVKMTEVSKEDELTEHNQFYYDALTGTIVIAMATFSEVVAVTDTNNAWNGTVANAFAGGKGMETDPYLIANADQLAYMGDRVSNDNANYGSAHYRLTADINIGGSENYNINGRKVLFYPIGYNKVGGTTTGKGDWYTYGGSFKGTFDGAGHTISGIYQNTWAMVGDYSGTYYNDAMGLFGYVNGGTVKNITIDNFYSEGEFAPTGCVTAYAAGNATFENIAITNSHPQTYNTGVAGIAGWDNGGDTESEASNFTFKNITIDDSNIISALWGSWDVAAAGLLGYLGEYSSANLENCNISATIDVYNDVCGNYQYYWYRYCGMMIGTVDKTDDKGKLDLSNITAKNCTANFGERHEYYYCEFEKNTQASYTEDYQFSRVPNSELNMNEVPVTCTHTHTANEDKQAVYIPFRQLFGGYGWGVDGVDLDEYPDIKIKEITTYDKFETKFTGDFLYRVGNKNTVPLDSLFEGKDGATINNPGVYVTIDKVNENTNVSGTFTANTTEWEKGTIKFDGTGVVKVTIQDYDYCKPTVLYLEVVDAVNATQYSDIKDGQNTVMLCNITMASGGTNRITNKKTFYGNGFTFDVSNGAYEKSGYDYSNYVIYLEDSTLNNVKIVGKVYPEYGGSKDLDYSRAIVMTDGECLIANSYISNGASPIRNGGNLKLVNTTLKGGNYANLDLRNGHLILDNVTTINQVSSNEKTEDGKVVVGLGIVVYQEGGTEDLKITVQNSLTQYNYLSETEADKYITNAYATAVTGAIFSTDFKDYQNDGLVNTGIISMNNYFTKEDLVDERTDKDSYLGTEKTVTQYEKTRNCYVYSFKPTKTVLAPEYVSPGQYFIAPSVVFDNSVNYNPKDDDDKCHCVSDGNIVDIEKHETVVEPMLWNPFILKATKFGKELDYTVTIDGKPTSQTQEFNETNNHTVVYTYTDPYNYKFDSDGNITSESVVYTEILEVNVNVKEEDAKPAEFSFGANGTAYSGKTILIGDKTYVMPDVTATVSGKIGSTTVSGTTVYYPITEMYTSDGVTAHKGSWYACFPIFKDALQIVDYADGGKGDAITYNQSTVTAVDKKPASLKATNPKSAFLYSMNATNYPPPTDPTAVSGAVCYTCNQNGLTASNERNEMTIVAEYTYTDNAGTEYYYYVGYHCAAQKNGCITPETLITLADGTQKEVQHLKDGEELLVWNLKTGSYDTAPIVFNECDEKSEHEIIHLYFSDGSDVEVIYEHGFFDINLGKYVYIRSDNAKDYIGHKFVKQGNIGKNTWETVSLSNVVIEKKVTAPYSPVTFEHLCYYTDGILSMPGGIDGLFNVFDVDTASMKYDAKKMSRDIENYGLFTYEDFNDIIPEYAYNAFNGKYLNVAIGKGYITWDDILRLAEKYGKYFN